MKKSYAPAKHCYFTVCALFVLTALVGLYKCFSQPPTLPSQDQQGILRMIPNRRTPLSLLIRRRILLRQMAVKMTSLPFW